MAGWNDKLQEYLASEDFVIPNCGGQLAYRYFTTLNLMLKFIVFHRLVDRASNRNEAFVQILDGRSS